MDLKTRLKSLLEEAEIYRSQGLFSDAKTKYEEAAKLIESHDQLKRNTNLLNAIAKKINLLENNSQNVETLPKSPEIPAKAQDLIKKLFSNGQKQDAGKAELEGAIALAKFGQFERALVEFNKLMQTDDSARFVCVKNILRCHVELSDIDEAIGAYRQWLRDEFLPPDQMEQIRQFLEKLLKTKKINQILPKAGGEPEVENEAAGGSEQEDVPKDKPEEFLDISTIVLEIDNDETQLPPVELDVSFQSGNIISLIIDKKNKDLINALKEGDQIDDIQFYSSIAIFMGSGIIQSKTQIESGPKRGDFSVDIRVIST